jgi:uncharacterized protein YndB with AHSA1/START domain
VSSYRHQAHLDAPLSDVWELVATPSRYPEWWPRVIEVRGERFEEGDEYAQVTRNPTGRINSRFLLERVDEFQRIRMTCQLTGAYADWSLTQAQGGTFVEIEMGMDPKRINDKLMDFALGRTFFRRWTKESLDALEDASGARPSPPPAASRGAPGG